MVCLACELDKLFLMYFGSAIGKDVRGAVDEACSQSNNEQDVVSDSLEQGDPLIITEMLTSSWKSSGMSNLAGYKQHDAHEFLNAFLGLMGVQAKKHWDRVYTAINAVRNDSSIAKSSDFAQQGEVLCNPSPPKKAHMASSCPPNRCFSLRRHCQDDF